MSSWPSTPRPKGVRITNDARPFISDAHNGRRQVVDGLGQRWAIEMAWPPLTREEWAPAEGFALAQGATGIFELVPHTHAAPLGAGLDVAQDAAENRIRWSERLDLSPWAYSDAPNISLGAAVTAPDGKTTGQLWTVAAANAEAFPSINQQVYVVLGQAAVVACYMRYESAPRSAIRLSNVTKSVDHDLVINWSAGAASAGAANGLASYGVVDVGGGWYRVSIVVDLASTGETVDSFKVHICPRYNDAAAAGGTYLWGAQLVALSSNLTPYLRTWAAARQLSAGPRVATRKNLIPESDEYDLGWWSATRAQKFGVTTAPDGSSAQLWGSTSGLLGTEYPIISGTSMIATATQYVLSCYVKAGTASVFGFSIYNASTATNYVARVNIAADGTMSFGTVVADDWGMEDQGGGWYRVWLMLDAADRGLTGNTLKPYFYPHLETTEATPRPQEYSAVWRVCLETGRTTPGHALGRDSAADPETATDSGTTVHTDGWDADATAILKQGDFIRFANHTKVYRITAVAEADAWGNAVLSIRPALISTPVAGQSVTVEDVPFTVSLDGELADEEWDENIWITPQLRFVERV